MPKSTSDVLDTLEQLKINIKLVKIDMFHKGLKINEALLDTCLKNIIKIKKDLK